MTATAGFYGKIPARGDFVRHALPPDFLNALDGWWQVALSGSRAALGGRWAEIWMEAPVWRFALAPGVCGAGAALGLWLPSTDKASRLFPLTIAAVAPTWRELARGNAFLEAAEAIGFRALEDDTGPDELAAAVAFIPGGEALEEPAAGSGSWWTDGSPLVSPAARRLAGMPDIGQFLAMLRDGDS